MLPPHKPKPQPFVNFYPKKFSILILCFGFKIELNTNTQEDEQHDSIYEDTEAEIKGFFALENLNAKTE